jgi:predicted transcriptional regulator
MENPLKKYLDGKKMTVHEFACKTTLSTTTLMGTVRGTHFPNRSTVCVICLFSDGKLTPHDFEMFKIYRKSLKEKKK